VRRSDLDLETAAVRARASCAEQVTDAIDTHVQSEQTRRGDDEDGSAGVLVPAG
jgi:hypothetical protein